MAHNWTVKEVAEKLISGGDREAILDFGKRYPLATHAIRETLTSKSMMFFGALQDNVTMGKIETALKKEFSADGEAEENTEETVINKPETEKNTTPVKGKGRPPKPLDPTMADGLTYEDVMVLKANEAFNIAINIGAEKANCKKVSDSRNEIIRIKGLKPQTEVVNANKPIKVSDMKPAIKKDTNYEGMKKSSKTPAEFAFKLFNELVNNRNIKAEPRQEASVYLAMLKEDDAKDIPAETDVWGSETQAQADPWGNVEV